MNFEEFKNIIFLLLSEDKECRTLGVELGKIYDLEIKPFFGNINIYTKSNGLIKIEKSNPSILVGDVSGYYDFKRGSQFNLKEIYEGCIERGVF